MCVLADYHSSDDEDEMGAAAVEGQERFNGIGMATSTLLRVNVWFCPDVDVGADGIDFACDWLWR